MKDHPTEDPSGLISAGRELAAALTGAALSYFAGPLVGAGTSVAMNHVLASVGAEIDARLLGPRQHARAGASWILARDEISARVMNGESLREDGFLTDSQSGAAEILEGVLIRSSVEYEERKVPLLARLYASIAFDASVSGSYANLLLRRADATTYRQLLFLGFLAYERHVEQLRQYAESSSELGFAHEAVADLDELGAAGLIGILQEDGSVTSPYGVFNGGSFSTLTPSKIRATQTGRDLSRLMRLDDMPKREYESVSHLLAAASR